MTRVLFLIPTFLVVLLFLPDARAMAVLPEEESKQTELGAYFKAIRFEDNKWLITLLDSGVRYSIQGSGRTTNYGQVLVIAPGTSLELLDKHGGLKITAQKNLPEQVVDIESHFDAGDFGGISRTTKFHLIHFIYSAGRQQDTIVLEGPSKTVSLR